MVSQASEDDFGIFCVVSNTLYVIVYSDNHLNINIRRSDYIQNDQAKNVICLRGNGRISVLLK
jgi:hypothetical protein